MPTSSLRAMCPLFVGASLFACGGARDPATATRESGQSGLMGTTFAGKNKCSPENHERPFVIEWDATDMSQFEAITVNDVVFVEYTGCKLRVVDSCRNDALKGSLGAYRTIDFTSGSVEKIDVRNEGDLYAKLPLSAGSLGGRVSAGETFQMEYFVAGTRTATRPALYKSDLAAVPGCRGVTHFVYAYNVGAFALGSTKNFKGEIGGSIGGAGAGGTTTSSNVAEKKGGTLATCASDSAKEIAGCKVPIRLSLRAIEDGTNPDATAALAPEKPDAKNLAGKIQHERADEQDAAQRLAAANEKSLHGDAKGCLAELDAFDKLQKGSATLSTTPNANAAHVRAACLMKAGQCDAGRELARKNLAKMGIPASAIDTSVESQVVSMCAGTKGLKPREELLRAMEALRDASFSTEKVDAKVCRDAYATIKRLRSSVPLTGELSMLPHTVDERGSACFVKANDCAGAFGLVRDEAGPNASAASVRSRFESLHPTCKGK